MRRYILLFLAFCAVMSSCDMIGDFLEDNINIENTDDKNDIEENGKEENVDDENINDENGNEENGDEENENLENPEQIVSPESLIFKTEADVKLAVSSVYLKLSDYIEAQRAVERVMLIDKEFMKITPRDSKIGRMWSAGYTAINQGNYCLKHLEIASEILGPEIVERYIGIVSALIGFTYKNMFEHWGGIPILYSDTTPDEHLPRASAEEMMHYITERLDLGLHILEREGYVNSDTISPQALLLASAEVKGYSDPVMAYTCIDKLTHMGDVKDVIFHVLRSESQEIINIYTKEHVELLMSEFAYVTGRHNEAKYDLDNLIANWRNDNYGYWSMLKRLGRFPEIVGCPEYMQNLPIPLSELEFNPNIYQNPGW